MVELFDKDGNLSEGAVTPEEVEQKLQEARQQAIEEANAARQEEIDDLTTQADAKDEELRLAKEELEKEKGKDKNLIGQRKVIEEKEKEVVELKKGFEEFKTQTEQRLGEIKTETQEKVVNGMIESLAGNDANLKEKMKFFYQAFKGEPKDEKEVEERVKNAYILATGGKATSPLSTPAISSAGGGMPQINPEGEKLSSDQQDLARRMGITDLELKKHKLI